MATQAELELVISMRDRAQAQIKGLSGQITGLGRALQGIGRISSSAGSIIAGGGLTALSGSVAALGLSFDSTEEQARLAFETILGSGAKADALLARLRKAALEMPFQYTDILRSAQRLVSSGFDPETVDRQMGIISDAISSTGDISRDKLDMMTGAFARMRQSGTFSMEAISELGSAGVNVLHLLAEQAGVSDFAMQRQLEHMSGRMPSGPMMDRIFGVLDARFHGLSAKQANTMQGVLNNIKDLIQQRLGAVMLPIFIRTEQLLRRIFYYLDQMREQFKRLPQPVQEAVKALAPWLLLLVPVGVALGTVALAVTGFVQALGAIGAVATAAAAVIAAIGWPLAALIVAVAAVAWAWTSNWLGIRGATESVVDWITTTLATFAGWVSAFLADPLGHVVALFQWLGSAVGSVIAAGWSYVVSVFQWLVDTVWGILVFALDGWLMVFGTNTQEVGGIIAAGWAYVVSVFQWLVDTVGPIISGAWTSVVGFFVWLITQAINLVSAGWQAVVDGFTWLKTTAVGIVSGLATTVVDWWNWMIGVLKNSPIGAAIGAIGGAIGGAVSIIGNNIPQLAEGGITRGAGLAYLHPNEAVIPLGSGRRVGGGDVHVHLYGNVYPNDIEDLVVRARPGAA